LFLSDRVNYDAITERFKELIPKAQEARTIEDFVMLVTIPFQLTVSDYAHLLDEKESDILLPSKIETQKEREELLEGQSSEHSFNLELLILLLVFVLVITEFIYIKIRGDL